MWCRIAKLHLKRLSQAYYLLDVIMTMFVARIVKQPQQPHRPHRPQQTQQPQP